LGKTHEKRDKVIKMAEMAIRESADGYGIKKMSITSRKDVNKY